MKEIEQVQYFQPPSLIVFNCITADHINKLTNESMGNRCLRSNCGKKTISKEKVCSFSVILDGQCGPNRGEENIVFFRECCHDVSNHLRRCHLSRENVSEINLILPELAFLTWARERLKR